MTTKVVSDGIFDYPAWEFDSERATPEDWKQLAAVWGNDGPKDWVQELGANLARVKPTPAIQLHIDAIRKVLAQLPTPTPASFSREQMQLLAVAQNHWKFIMVLRDVMPKASQAAKRSKQLTEFAVKGNKARTKYTDSDKTRWRNLVASDASLARLRQNSARECAKVIAQREGLPQSAAETIRRSI